MFFLGRLSSLVHSMQNQTRSTKWHSAINLSMRSTCLSLWSISVFMLHFFWLEFLNILHQVLCSQPLPKTVWIC